MGVVWWCVKVESQFLHSPSRINSFILPPSSGQCTTVALQFRVSSAVEARLGSKSAIDDWSTSRCQSIQITSNCNRLDRAMLLLAFLDSPSIFRASYDWNGWLHFPSLARCWPPLRLISIFVHGMAILLPSGQDGMEWKHHFFFFGGCCIQVVDLWCNCCSASACIHHKL